MSNFEIWWRNVGSGIHPMPSEDSEEHAKRVSALAWSAGSLDLLEAAKNLSKELDVLRNADTQDEDWMPVNYADDALIAAIAKATGETK